MAKRTHIDIAEDHGVKIPVIKKLSREGINVYIFEDVAAALAKQNHRIKPGAELSKSAQVATEGLTTIAELEEQALEATSIDDVKIIKEKVAVLQGVIKVEKERGKLIPIAEVDERDTRIAAAVKASFSKLKNDLPPELEGLASADMCDIIGNHIVEILTDLANAQSEFWKDKEL
tara:strand:+ start:625 stop:1149 length:525 start_codon:yes stop_codon:yes gene_type:complete